MSGPAMEKNRYGAVILAAGYSSRMGSFKPTLKIGDESVVARLQRIFKENSITDITVVGGHSIELLKEEIKEGSRLIFNENFDQGMFTSIQKGIESYAGDEGLRGVFLTPVDCPLISGETVGTMVREIEGSRFAVPLYLGKKGHPLYIPKEHIEEIIGHDGINGLKGITDKYQKEFERIETVDIGCVLDMDTPEDYERIKAFYGEYMIDEAGNECSFNRFDGLSEIKEEAKGRTFYLLRHGEPVQHERGKIFLGQTDIPLSEEGRRQAEAIRTKRLEELDRLTEGLTEEKVYASPLKRAMETAVLAYPQSEIVPVDGFKEMNLGPWDGRYIEDIKREESGLFEERGRNLFTFKIGNKGENFYDLQYRVMMSLLDILRTDKSKVITIVSHSGVIRCIENMLDGKLVDSEWKRPGNGEVRKVRR